MSTKDEGKQPSSTCLVLAIDQVCRFCCHGDMWLYHLLKDILYISNMSALCLCKAAVRL